MGPSESLVGMEGLLGWALRTLLLSSAYTMSSFFVVVPYFTYLAWLTDLSLVQSSHSRASAALLAWINPFLGTSALVRDELHPSSMFWLLRIRGSSIHDLYWSYQDLPPPLKVLRESIQSGSSFHTTTKKLLYWKPLAMYPSTIDSFSKCVV